MKKLICFLLIFTVFIPTAFAADAQFVNNGNLKVIWADSDVIDFDYFELFKSEESSTPRDESLIQDSEALEYTDENVLDGVTYYQLCAFSTSQDEVCDKVIAVSGKYDLILDPAVEEFLDIEGHWAFNYIEKLRFLNVVQGDDNSNFNPNRNIVRAEAIKIIMLAFGIGGTSCHSEFFPDMSAGDWFCDVVSKAYQLEYVVGDEGILYPGREITRAEAVKIVLSVLGDDVPEITVKPFNDVEPGEWYAKYIAKAKELGIVQGVDNGNFEPNRSITRAELSKIAVLTAKL